MHRRPDRQRFRPEWPAIEIDYRKGDLSLRQMSVKHRCAPSTIANKATREGWPRRDCRPHATALEQKPTPAGGAGTREPALEGGIRFRSILAALRPDPPTIADDCG